MEAFNAYMERALESLGEMADFVGRQANLMSGQATGTIASVGNGVEMVFDARNQPGPWIALVVFFVCVAVIMSQLISQSRLRVTGYIGVSLSIGPSGAVQTVSSKQQKY